MSVIATPVLSPSAEDIVSSDRLDIIVPQFSRSYDETLQQKIRAARIRQGVTATIQFQLYGPDSKPVELTAYGLVTGSSSSSTGLTSSSSLSSSSFDSNPGTVRAKIREVTEIDPSLCYDADLSVFDADNGVVRVTVPETVYTTPGVYWLDIGLLNSNAQLLFVQSSYLFVERSAWRESTSPLGPPLVDEIRLNLRDSDIYENLLIDNHDFDIAELCVSIMRAVSFWNERPPHMTGQVFTTQNFPYREIWMRGIQLYLFQMAEEHYRRNKLEATAGGHTMNDKNRDREYKAAWQERYQDFTMAVTNKKSSININRGFATIRQMPSRRLW